MEGYIEWSQWQISSCVRILLAMRLIAVARRKQSLPIVDTKEQLHARIIAGRGICFMLTYVSHTMIFR